MNMKYVVVLVIAIAAISEAAEYTVGDDMGWMVPPTPDYYAKWASKYYFVQNDTLVFNFVEGVHDITILDKEDFESCNMAAPLGQFSTPGRVTFLSSDTFYLTCSFGQGQHCLNGQKMAITFASSPMPPMPSPSPCPSASSGSEGVQSDSESKSTFKFVSAKKEKKSINNRKMISLTMA